jgi:hypothetical protein
MKQHKLSEISLIVSSEFNEKTYNPAATRVPTAVSWWMPNINEIWFVTLVSRKMTFLILVHVRVYEDLFKNTVHIN